MKIFAKVYLSIVLLWRKILHLIRSIIIFPFQFVRRSSKRINQIPEENNGRDIED
jgi:hypothetical protein